MSRSGNAPRTGCATADRLIVPDLVYRRLPPKGARRFRFSPNAFELAGPEPRPRADTITRPGTNLHGNHSAKQYRSDSAADFATQDGHHHDPVCRAAGRGRGGAGAGLEPLIFRKVSARIRQQREPVLRAEYAQN